jgi:hypothetical protein
MSYSISTFSELAAKYPSWEELRAYLTSAEGGSLRVVEPSENEATVIIRYTKGISDFSLTHVPHFRSVVWNKVTNRPESVAPVKASEGSAPASQTLRISDFAEGTMIQAWKDASGNLRIATRTSLGAKGTFYSPRSFSELLNDSLEFSLDSMLEPNDFISMVLQHKEHKIVAPVAKNRVFVTHYGDVAADGTVNFYYDSHTWPNNLASFEPQVYEVNAPAADAQAIFQKMQNKSHTWQGLVFQSTSSSNRWRMRNPAYMTARALRGSEATAMERFLRLRAAGETKKYLSYFREENGTMWDLEQLLRQRTLDLYMAYCDMNKLKTKGMRELPYCFRPHVYALHGKYLSTLPKPVPVIKQTAIEYVNGLSIQEQLKLLQGSLEIPLTAAPDASDPPLPAL